MDEDDRAVSDDLSSLIEALLAGIRIVDRDGKPSLEINPAIADLIDAHPALLAPAVDGELVRRQAVASSGAGQGQLEVVRRGTGDLPAGRWVGAAPSDECSS